jgi:hypothetical protein
VDVPYCSGGAGGSALLDEEGMLVGLVVGYDIVMAFGLDWVEDGEIVDRLYLEFL